MKNKIIFKTLMLKGEAGSTIVSMEKTGHVGTADIYTITFNDGSTTEISLENMSAITSVEKTSSTDTEDIYTITCADGSTQTFSVLNHNADIAAMSDDIDTIDARVDNFINSVVPNTVETLWTGSINKKNDSATLSKAVSNFDYIDLYLLGSADAKYIRIPASQSSVDIQQQNMSDDASSNFLRLWEMGVSISGTTVSITKVIAWAWDDPDNSNPTATADAQNAIPITRIDGVIIASDAPAELIDIRVGANDVIYASAGAAVRGQYNTEKTARTNADAELSNEINKKIARPLDEFGNITNGQNGQILRTKGDGSTEWSDVGLPTDEQTSEAVTEWLNGHPDVTTSVQDGSLTFKKLVTGTLGFVTPEMFGAIGDGVVDDRSAFVSAIAFALQNSINAILCTKNNYYISQQIIINGHNLIIDGNNARFVFGTSGFFVTETSYNIAFRNMTTECSFAKGSTNPAVTHFGIVGETTTARYLAHDVLFENISVSGGVFGIAINSAKNINIIGCKFGDLVYKGDTTGGYGILVQSSIFVSIRNCSFDSGLYGRHDIYISVDPNKTANINCEDIIIDNCYFSHENLELDDNGHYYSPSTIPVQVRATTGISITNCKVYSAVGFAVFLGTEGAIIGATAKNIVVDSPVYNNGVSEQKAVISLNGGSYGANVNVDGLNVLNVPSNYQICVELVNSVFKLSNAIIGSTRITTANSILYLNNIDTAIDEYFVRFYGTASGDISNIKCTGLTNPVYKYYIDSGASVNPSIFESKTATLEFTPTSGFTAYQSYPDGFYYGLCTVIGIEVYLNGSWRSGNITARTSVDTRTFVSLEADGIRMYNDEANLSGYIHRVTIKQIK